MNKPKVRIAAPSHTLNPNGSGYTIYAEWSYRGDNGELRTMSQTLDYAMERSKAEEARERWDDALS